VGRDVMLGRENALEVGKLGRMRGSDWSIDGSFANMEHFHIILQILFGGLPWISCIILYESAYKMNMSN
jgi:hypothetical protein